MLTDLLVGCDEGLSDDDTESIVEAERNAMRAERRRRDQQQGQPVAP